MVIVMLTDYIYPIATVACGVVWAVRLEGRVNGHDTLFEERKAAQIERDLDIKNRLVRIETKLDNAKVRLDANGN